MSPFEILEKMLRDKMGGGASKAPKGGPDIFGDIFGGGKEPKSQPRSAPAPRRESPTDIKSQAKELEEMLNVGRSASPAAKRNEPEKPSVPSRSEEPDNSSWANSPFSQAEAPFAEEPVRDEQAVLLIRAMLNAAKCDGEVNQAEQQKILSSVGDDSPDTLQFLREELAKPLNIQEFALSVPVGMEQQVYTAALAAIKLDNPREASYLKELAKYLRLPVQTCNQIHDRLGATRSS